MKFSKDFLKRLEIGLVSDGSDRYFAKAILFSCDSSSITRNVGRSVCLSVGRSGSNEFYRSVMLLVMFICCYYYCSLDYQNILWLFFAFLSCDSSSIGHNVSLQVCLSAKSFMEVLCCY